MQSLKKQINAIKNRIELRINNQDPSKDAKYPSKNLGNFLLKGKIMQE